MRPLHPQSCALDSVHPYTSGDIACSCLNMPNRTVTLNQLDGPNEPRLYGCMPDTCVCANGKKIAAAHIIFTSYTCMDRVCSNPLRNVQLNKCDVQCNTISCAPNCPN